MIRTDYEIKNYTSAKPVKVSQTTNSTSTQYMSFAQLGLPTLSRYHTVPVVTVGVIKETRGVSRCVISNIHRSIHRNT